ncbi:MAG: HEAT repeat domain-containing protein [Deltaproteobacteria bacterium]|nr:HEAT repeat domain-containing protein [Deltaproteobacteria bacterium]
MGADVAVNCPALEAVVPAFALSGEPDNAVLERLRAVVERGLAEAPRDCAIAFSRLLANDSRCELVYDAVAIRVMTGPNASPTLAASELLREARCRWKLVTALRQSRKADPTLAATLLSLTSAADRDVANSAWLTVGTLANVARRPLSVEPSGKPTVTVTPAATSPADATAAPSGTSPAPTAGAAQSSEADVSPPPRATMPRPEVGACLDRIISSELEASSGDRLQLLLGVAGNAGCGSCRPTLRRHLASPDTTTRRRAVSAFRFLEEDEDTNVLCKAATTDTDDTVRGAATYALRFAAASVTRRLECLYEVAVGDDVERVAQDAVGSLTEIPGPSELVIATLVQVARETPHPKVRAEAIAFLRTRATDEALREVLGSPH